MSTLDDPTHPSGTKYTQIYCTAAWLDTQTHEYQLHMHLTHASITCRQRHCKATRHYSWRRAAGNCWRPPQSSHSESQWHPVVTPHSDVLLFLPSCIQGRFLHPHPELKIRNRMFRRLHEDLWRFKEKSQCSRDKKNKCRDIFSPNNETMVWNLEIHGV